MSKPWPAIAAAALWYAAGAASGENLSDLFEPSREPRVSLGFYWWSATSKSEIGYPATYGGTDNTLDLRDDLNHDPALGLPLGKLSIDLSKRWLLRLEYWQGKQEEELSLDRSVVFGDQTFLKNEQVHSTLEARSLDVIAAYRILKKEWLDAYFLGGLNVSWFDHEMRAGTKRGTFSLTQTSNLLGLGIQYRLSSRISIDLSGVGFFLRSLNLDESLAEGDCSLAVRLAGAACFTVGYRAYWLSAEDRVNEFNCTATGPYAGLSWAF